MADESQESQENVVEKLQGIMIQQIKAGADKSAIVARLEEMEVPRDQGIQLVDALHSEIMRAAKAEELAPAGLVPAVLGGVLAALLGGGIWGAIVIFTGYEVGYVAWGLGFLSGAAVVLFARGRKGLPLQATAGISSLARC